MRMRLMMTKMGWTSCRGFYLAGVSMYLVACLFITLFVGKQDIDNEDIEPHVGTKSRQQPLARRRQGHDECSSEDVTFTYLTSGRAPYYNVSYYSGYLDERGSTLKARILVYLTWRRGARPLPVKCPDGTEVVAYEMCENHAMPYGAWMLTCDMTHTPVDHRCPTITMERTIPLLRVRAGTPSAGRVAVCVAPLRGHISLERMLTFLEMQWSLGAGHVFLYAATGECGHLAVRLERLYGHGKLTVLEWALPSPNIWSYGQLLAGNDCVYRAAAAGYEYALSTDLDEVLVPRSHVTWQPMMAALRNGTDDACAGYSFASVFFDPTYEPIPLLQRARPGTATGEVGMVDYTRVTRTRATSRVRTKVMTLPVRIFELGIHHVSRSYESRYRELCEVHEDMALIHHYRKCTTLYDTQMNCDLTTTDDTLASMYDKRLLLQRSVQLLQEMETAAANVKVQL